MIPAFLDHERKQVVPLWNTLTFITLLQPLSLHFSPSQSLLHPVSRPSSLSFNLQLLATTTSVTSSISTGQTPDPKHQILLQAEELLTIGTFTDLY
ncbi:hypothetical protein Pmani_035534 [Petrolisthes manimaculis]|uniref:Uncharacterized protein n=1 Tax=Petrolisthes manimaculis TaxID=1843537 RepID=A0AAE1TQF6_9EUCA|nr:hypothetical protein Pmani_035534 [Petrolisthes manimaculis]